MVFVRICGICYIILEYESFGICSDSLVFVEEVPICLPGCQMVYVHHSHVSFSSQNCSLQSFKSGQKLHLVGEKSQNKRVRSVATYARSFPRLRSRTIYNLAQQKTLTKLRNVLLRNTQTAVLLAAVQSKTTSHPWRDSPATCLILKCLRQSLGMRILTE